jgi:hypothetical protein
VEKVGDRGLGRLTRRPLACVALGEGIRVARPPSGRTTGQATENPESWLRQKQTSVPLQLGAGAVSLSIVAMAPARRSVRK